MKDDKISNDSLFLSIRSLIEESKKRVAVTVNNELTLLYWNVGNLIQQELLKYERAEYGQRVVKKLSEDLTTHYGKGWGLRHLYNCIKFRNVFPDVQIVHTLCAQLSWSHLRILMGIEEELKRNFYIEICRIERWSVKMLRDNLLRLLSIVETGYRTVHRPDRARQSIVGTGYHTVHRPDRAKQSIVGTGYHTVLMENPLRLLSIVGAIPCGCPQYAINY